ncbi:MAG: universal stress protein [Betaproteobacteria bacterium]
MYKRIMVAIDDSFATSKVLDSAIESARQHGAKLAICHAIDETIFAQREAAIMLSSSVGQVTRNLKESAREFVDLAAEKARKAGVEVETLIVESELGHVAEMLAQASAEWQADLLVVGTHGRRGVERFFVGSVAEKLVSKASTSLLLVRGN